MNQTSSLSMPDRWNQPPSAVRPVIVVGMGCRWVGWIWFWVLDLVATAVAHLTMSGDVLDSDFVGVGKKNYFNVT